MSSPTPPPREDDGPGRERTITLTDAVVAIAMTLLVLPLVEVAGDVDVNRLGEFLGEHSDLLLSFVISFLVIHVFWSAHGSAFRLLDGTNRAVPGLNGLNMLWLLFIAVLPFPTAIVGRRLTTTSAPIYIATMLVLSILTVLINRVIERAVGLPRSGVVGWLNTAVLGVCAVISAFDSTIGMFALLLLIPVRVVDARMARRRPKP